MRDSRGPFQRRVNSRSSVPAGDGELTTWLGTAGMPAQRFSKSDAALLAAAVLRTASAMIRSIPVSGAGGGGAASLQPNASNAAVAPTAMRPSCPESAKIASFPACKSASTVSRAGETAAALNSEIERILLKTRVARGSGISTSTESFVFCRQNALPAGRRTGNRLCDCIAKKSYFALPGFAECPGSFPQ